MRKLSIQLRTSGLKAVYTGSGTLLNAVALDDPQLLVEHAAYWAAARNLEEARYLTAVLNSATVLARIIPMQPRGWRDPRHFDNLVWELNIPEFDRRQVLHRELADAAQEAERVAAPVPLREGAHFMRQRRAIRDALADDGVALQDRRPRFTTTRAIAAASFLLRLGKPKTRAEALTGHIECLTTNCNSCS